MELTEGAVPRPLGRGTSRGRGKGYTIQNLTQRFEGQLTLTPDVQSEDPIPPESVSDSNDQQEKIKDELEEVEKPTRGSSDSKQVITVGTQGNEYKCITNFIRLVRSKDAPVYEYSVSFNPPMSSLMAWKKVLKQLEHIIGPIQNFDGHILYLPMKLENKITTICCTSPIDSSKEVNVTIKFMDEKAEHELLHFYDILFERVLVSLGFIKFRRGFYEAASIKELRDKKLQVWPGVCLSVEYKETGLMVMLDTPRRVLRTETAYDHYLAMRGTDEEKAREDFAEFVIGKVVACKSNRKCYKVDDIAWDLNPMSSFEYLGKMITYKDYYYWQYGIEVKDLEQPLLVSRIKPRNTLNLDPRVPIPTELVKFAMLVPELCVFTGLSFEHRNDPEIMTDVNLLTKLIPSARVNLMRSLVDRIIEDEDTFSILEEWGLTLERNPIVVTGREIKPPCLQFHKSTKGKAVGLNFSKDATRSCYDPIEINNYAVLCSRHDKEKVGYFITRYREACAILGIRVRCSPNIIIVNGNEPHDFVEQLTILNANEIQFAIIITPNQREDVYRAVKIQCTKVSPLPSQCILGRTLNHKYLGKVALNVALQINCKLGGAPWALRTPKKKIMFCGMDAAHDPTRKNPSVIALIASMNDECTKFFSRPNILPIHQEIATCLRTMFIDALSAYRQINGELPAHVIFYRDGGNAGSFEALKRYEVDVCVEVLEEEQARCGLSEKVDFSYICVAKRIPQRIMHVSKDNDIVNAAPGVVIDTTVTQPWLYDFYIVSQLANQGTSAPTHYTVLFETTPTSPDLMQKLAYSLTYMYYNFQGIIKVPAVIQYAHKLGQFCSRMKTIPSREIQMELFYL